MNNETNDDTGQEIAGTMEPATAGEEVLPAKGKWLLPVTLVLALAALVVSIFVYYQGMETTNRLPLIEQTYRQLSLAERNIQNLEKQQSVMDQNLSELKYEQDLFASRLESLQQKDTTVNPDWPLEEIRQLLIIASHKLALEADIATALAAMQAADNILKQSVGQPGMELRKQLSGDMNKLRAVSQPDIPGMSIYLADIVTRVTDLPLQQTDKLIAASGSEPAAQRKESPPAWRRFLGAIWQELKGLIVISTSNSDATFALLPEQRYFLYQNLGLQLQVARLCVLQRDTENFRKSVEIINEWLASYFDNSDPGVSNIMESLALMTQVELEPVLPDTGAALETVRAMIAKQGNDVEPLTIPAP